MSAYCCLCGRPLDKAAVTIGQMPVGPKCAKRAGLLALAKRRAGLVAAVAKGQHLRKTDDRTMELFPDD